MAVANKAFVWALFAAGGTLTALLFPVLIVLFLLVSTGFVPPGLELDQMSRFTASWPGRIVWFTTLSLAVWHAAHRMRVLAHDLGIRADRIIAWLVYSTAAIATVASMILLASVESP